MARALAKRGAADSGFSPFFSTYTKFEYAFVRSVSFRPCAAMKAWICSQSRRTMSGVEGE